MGWREDKEARKQYYLKYIYGWKQRPCTACNGSGYYDNDGSPPCGGCDGTGKETYEPETNQNGGNGMDDNKNMFFCKYIHTKKCFQRDFINCNKCELNNICKMCENSWNSNTCNQCLNKNI